MRKISLTFQNLLIAVGLFFVSVSAFVMVNRGIVGAKPFAQCTNDCPNGKQVTCKGSRVQTIDDPADPGCICDGKKYLCSEIDKNANTNANTAAENGNQKTKKDKKKKKDSKANNNTNSQNTNSI